MQYPKPLMSISELKKMGFARHYLYEAVHSIHSSSFIHRKRGSANTKILIDTAEFEKIRKRGEI